jgi:hypothetical protein
MARLKVVCFKWKRNKTGFMLPHVCDYGPEHVRILKAMVERHLRIPHDFICITDDQSGLDHIETIPLWDKCRDLGGCYNRLYAFSQDMQDIIGGRFVMIDLDCVIVKDITSLFEGFEDFKINAYSHADRDQHYNGGMVLMDPGARRHVWDQFDPKTSPAELEKLDYVIGSDQAWIRHILGKGESRFTEDEGVYNFIKLKHGSLPGNARMVFFAGKRDPSQCKHIDWVRDNWRV